MRAIEIREFGDPSVLSRAERPMPKPAAGEVLVRIAAASVNPIDTKIRRNGPPMAPELPGVLGCDFAGTIEAVGDGVDDLSVGDQVYGSPGGVRGTCGAYAEYAAADARCLAPKPEALDMRQAAAMPLVGITAWEGLVIRGGITPGMNILIHGGAGGVGHAAIQIAKAHGARVTTTVSSQQKADLVRELGADEVVFYREEAVEDYVERLTRGEGFDLVFDATGGSDLPTSFKAARLNGQVVTIVSQYQADLTLMHLRGLTLHVVFMIIPVLYNQGRAVHGEILRNLSALVEQGHYKPLLDPTRFTLEQAAEAHRRLEAGEALGKLVLDVDVS
ncbi:zinc-dependent alcohol dehydrogenase family protein [Methylonatrum kenyense]|uniref:zinc-dependent alcohol dehydrogenase family protein n=1 Tax=Methylonatrum kenyense TaxID=455253 RepID=UPI0020BEF587|nr:zinc-dependent alcohol dehydrogenase family protein [Methylonatrum kenyense]MCK8516469.1 zinc-dependent alcohol dehydrogenase family protein [Methylonatrum kenyense]